MKKSTTLKFLLISLIVLAGNAVKAQITTTAGLAPAVGVFCPGTPVTLKSASTNATSYVWIRYPGKDLTGTPTTIAGATTDVLSDAITNPGYYTYVSISQNADHCTSETSAPVTIYVLPGITASIVSNKANADNHYCTSAVPTGADAITLTATADKAGTTVNETFAYNYQWYKGTTLISGATGTTYTLNSTNDSAVGASDYTVQVSYVLKTCTAQTSNAVTVTVNDVPGKPVITVTP